MTDKEKYEFLKKTLKENGWESNCVKTFDNDCKEISEESKIYKKDVDICVNNLYESSFFYISISIKRKTFFSVLIGNLEIYSDHIEFMYEGASVMIRFSDAYVLMEYQP